MTTGIGAIAASAIAFSLAIVSGAAQAQPVQPDLGHCTLPPGASDLRTGTNCRRIMVDGFERDYLLTIPYPRPEGPLPLVVALPDSGAWFSLFSRINGFNGAVDDGEAIMVVPHPLPYLLVDDRGDPLWIERWDPGETAAASPRPPGYPDEAPWPADDAAFVAAVIAAVEAEVAIDSTRIFVSGLGDAGLFAVRLAHAKPDLFAAAGVGVVGFDLGLPPGLKPSPAAIPVFAMLGNEDRDATALFGGDDVPMDPAAILGVPALFANVLNAFGLPDTPCDAALREDGNVTTIVYCTADGRAGFTFVLVHGVGHEAPNAINNPARYTYGPEMWRFFESVRP